MPDTEAELPETYERRCPICYSDQIAAKGHVVATTGLIKADYRCEVCGRAFRFVRKPLA